MTIVINDVEYMVGGDAVDPSQLPNDLDAYFGYDNGKWADFVAIAQAHKLSHLCDITVFAQNTGTAGDFEPGDMEPSQAVWYYWERTAAGVWRPVFYGSVDGYMVEILQDLNAANIARSSYRVWTAHYGRGQHICGPDTCNEGAGRMTSADATQWIDHGGWDESLIRMDFFGGNAPNPAPTPDPPKQDEENEVNTDIIVIGNTVHQGLTFPGWRSVEHAYQTIGLAGSDGIESLPFPGSLVAHATPGLKAQELFGNMLWFSVVLSDNKLYRACQKDNAGGAAAFQWVAVDG